MRDASKGDAAVIVTSYFTRVGRYPDLAARLAASCDRFGIACEIAEFPDPGDSFDSAQDRWLRGTSQKPGRILATLLKHRQPVLWMDADCELLAPPELLLKTDADFAIYSWLGKSRDESNRLMCSGGVSLWGYTAPAMELLMRWQAELAEKTPCEDDPLLDSIFNTIRPPVNLLILPKVYNWMTGKWGDAPADCVIRHDYCAGGHRTNS